MSSLVGFLKRDWKKMSAALDADLYRIQGQGYPPTPAINFCREFGSDSEILWSADKVSAKLWRLKNKNDSGLYNIYCCPVCNDVGYFLIDDVNTDTKRVGLESEYGSPAVVLQSSENNFQYIYKVRVAGLDLNIDRFNSPARRGSNLIVKKINSKYGDPRISGVFHQFRIPGFKNVKPGRNNYICQLHCADDIFNEIISDEISTAVAEESKVQLRVLKLNINKKKIGKILCPDTIDQVVPIDQASKDYLRYFHRAEGLAQKQGWVSDASVCDFSACKAMLRDGYSQETVVTALIAISPQLQIRHPQVEIYATETVRAASRTLLCSGPSEERGEEGKCVR